MDYEVERRLNEKAKADSFYRELLGQCLRLAEDYERIRNSLPEEDRDILEWYICSCEELEYRRTCLAYAMGTRDGLRSGTAQIRI